MASTDRRFRIGVIALDARYGSRPITSSAALSPVMWLRSLEDAAAEQAAEQNAAFIAQQQASAQPGPVPSSEQSGVQPSSSRSTDRIGKTDNDEDGDSLSDDSSSEPPAVEASKSGLPFPRTFEEYRKYWGTRLKDIAAQFGVPESGLSKVRSCCRLECCLLNNSVGLEASLLSPFEP